MLTEGVGGGDTTLCARLLDFPPGYILTNGSSFIPGLALAYIYPDTDFHPYAFAFVSNAGAPHFPYGLRVPPNVPL